MEQQENEKRSDAWFPQLTRMFGSESKGGDPKTDWLEEPSQWRRLYPAGCPDRRLKDYLRSQLDLSEEDCEEVMQLIDVDSSGTIDWEELSGVLMDLKPNLQNRTFVMRRKQTEQILESQAQINEDIIQMGKDLDLNALEDKLQKITKLCEELVK